MKAILIDLHHTLLNEDLTINKLVANVVKCLSSKYKILGFTAENLQTKEQLQNVGSILSKINIAPEDFYYLNSELLNDVDKKLKMLQDIKQEYDVKLLIDNNKKVCKAFKNIGIDVMRYKKPLTEQ